MDSLRQAVCGIYEGQPPYEALRAVSAQALEMLRAEGFCLTRPSPKVSWRAGMSGRGQVLRMNWVLAAGARDDVLCLKMEMTVWELEEWTLALSLHHVDTSGATRQLVASTLHTVRTIQAGTSEVSLHEHHFAGVNEGLYDSQAEFHKFLKNFVDNLSAELAC